MKKPLGILLLILSFLAAAPRMQAADTTVKYNVVRIDRADGVTERLMLDPALVIKFADNAIFLVHPQLTVEYPIDDLSTFSYEKSENPTLYDGTHQSALDEVTETEHLVSITSEAITIGGSDPIRLYDLRGIEQARAESDGSAAILPLSGLQPGIYIVRCGTLTLKISL